jgi:arylsulfatase A-like enzyme
VDSRALFGGLVVAAWSLASTAGADRSPAAVRPTAEPRRPNVVVIVSDDAGYADFGFQGSTQVPTPHLDALAARGVRFTSGYVTAAVCSPSRAGLLTGRYQQRFGHETNIPPRYSETNGLPVEETLLSDLLREQGYRTIALGKWHLGYAPQFHPLSRGFDDYWGFLQGARSYRPIEGTRLNRLLRDREAVPEGFEYMTDALADEAAAYIDAHAQRPFLLYLAFNAVHTPMHADPAVLEEVQGIEPPRRQKLVAMTISLDRAVGRVMEALREHGLERDTLVVFVNDNGGATNNASINTPLRGTKGTPFEGGVRVPFLMSWPGQLPEGVDYDLPVSTLDVLPTALAAAGRATAPSEPIDGVDLLPFLTGAAAGRPHDILFWHLKDDRAVRDGDWKLVLRGEEGPLLFDLAADPAESRDLAGEQPERVAELLAKLAAWEAELAEPRW